MKKILILLLLLTAVYSREGAPKVQIQKKYYGGHQYIVATTDMEYIHSGGGGGGSVSIIHSPDCTCHKTKIENKEGN